MREKIASEPTTVRADDTIFTLAHLVASKYCEAENLEDASRILEEVIYIKKENDIFFFDSQRTHAEVQLKMNDIAKAETLCREIIEAETLPPRVFCESFLLMALICHARGDTIEAKGYKGLVPPEYQGTSGFWKL